MEKIKNIIILLLIIIGSSTTAYCNTTPFSLKQFENGEKPSGSKWVVTTGVGSNRLSEQDFKALREAIANSQSPISLTIIGERGLAFDAFAFCTNLKSVDVSAFTNIPGRCFKSSSIESVTVSHNVVNIGDSSFSGCKNLKTVKIASSHRTAARLRLGVSAFINCSSLIEIEVSRYATEICDYVFYNCVALPRIDLSSAVSIGTIIVGECRSLKHIDLSAKGDFVFTTTDPAARDNNDGRSVFNAFFLRARNANLVLNNDKLNRRAIPSVTQRTQWLTKNDTSLTPIMWNSIMAK